MKIRMYGAPICADCVEAKEQLSRLLEVELDYRNIIESTSIMKEFLALRDKEECFQIMKEAGKIGIPFFILEDGTKTFDIETYAAVKLTKNKPMACSLDGKNC